MTVKSKSRNNGFLKWVKKNGMQSLLIVVYLLQMPMVLAEERIGKKLDVGRNISEITALQGELSQKLAPIVQNRMNIAKTVKLAYDRYQAYQPTGEFDLEKNRLLSIVYRHLTDYMVELVQEVRLRKKASKAIKNKAYDLKKDLEDSDLLEQINPNSEAVKDSVTEGYAGLKNILKDISTRTMFPQNDPVMNKFLRSTVTLMTTVKAKTNSLKPVNIKSRKLTEGIALQVYELYHTSQQNTLVLEFILDDLKSSTKHLDILIASTDVGSTKKWIMDSTKGQKKASELLKDEIGAFNNILGNLVQENADSESNSVEEKSIEELIDSM